MLLKLYLMQVFVFITKARARLKISFYSHLLEIIVFVNFKEGFWQIYIIFVLTFEANFISFLKQKPHFYKNHFRGNV